ncbi:hypothetical protein [Hominifimenecus sp. rT4P-3]|uniref:hypothetical protein n=1 Tax=Hominifimenecus sp. rT4P-3 TaxID=3242979 RepID=UPI003DA3DA30
MMKKFRKFLASPQVTVGAFILAVGLLLFSSIGGTRAALAYYSENYVSRVQMHNIGVNLLENGTPVSGALLAEMLGEDKNLKPGKEYAENLCVQNSGEINEYVRVSIYKYWQKDGEKITSLSPDLIQLNLVNVGAAWLEDEEAKTPERTVLYYSKVLEAGETSALFADKLTIDGAIATKVKQTADENGTITTVYEYDGVEFCVEAKVDAVQEHNGEAAIKSAWGREVSVSGGSLSLK